MNQEVMVSSRLIHILKDRTRKAMNLHTASAFGERMEWCMLMLCLFG